MNSYLGTDSELKSALINTPLQRGVNENRIAADCEISVGGGLC